MKMCKYYNFVSLQGFMILISNFQELVEEKASSQTSKEPLCMQKIHRKVLDKGIPPDAMPGIKGVKVKNIYHKNTRNNSFVEANMLAAY